MLYYVSFASLTTSTRIEVKDGLSIAFVMNVSLDSIPVIGIFFTNNGNRPERMMPDNAVATSNLNEDGSNTNVTTFLSPGTYWIAYGLREHKVADVQLYIYSSRPLRFF